jgi:RNA polymerase sigma factor (sigma-70 family)
MEYLLDQKQMPVNKTPTPGSEFILFPTWMILVNSKNYLKLEKKGDNLATMNNLLKIDKFSDLSKSDLILANVRSPKTENELWRSFRSGSREALNEIFEKYVRLLVAYGRNMTGDQGLISDCIQDIFVELWTKRELLTAQVNSIKYYLIQSVRRRIVRRLSADRRFSGQAIPANYDAEVEFHIEFNLIQDQTSREISFQMKSSVDTLSKRQQEAVYLKFYGNLTYEEIASIMNTNVKAVYNLIGKSILLLRTYFRTHPLVTK